MGAVIHDAPLDVAAPRHRMIAIRDSVPEPRRRGSRMEAVRSTLDVAADAERIDERDALREVGLEDVTRAPDVLRQDPERAGFVALPLAHCYVLDAPDRGLLNAASDTLEGYTMIPDIEFGVPEPSEPGARMRYDAVAPLAEICEESGLALAREDGNHGAGAVIAVLDTGCDADHREFAGRRVAFASVPRPLGAPVREVRGFDGGNHGTHVAGIAAGSDIGIAPAADLLVASVIETDAVRTTLDRVLRGLQWLLSQLAKPEHDDKPAVLNLSLGFKRDWLAPTEVANALYGVRLVLQRLIDVYDVLPIVAVGNDGPGTVRAPSYFPEVLSVGAVDGRLESAAFSGGGPGPMPFEDRLEPDVVGLGVEVVSSLERDVDGTSWYGPKSGTSMAAPYVTGVAALVAARTRLEGAALRDHLMSNALPLPAQPRERVGAGLVRYAL